MDDTEKQGIKTERKPFKKWEDSTLQSSQVQGGERVVPTMDVVMAREKIAKKLNLIDTNGNPVVDSKYSMSNENEQLLNLAKSVPIEELQKLAVKNVIGEQVKKGTLKQQKVHSTVNNRIPNDTKFCPKCERYVNSVLKANDPITGDPIFLCLDCKNTFDGKSQPNETVTKKQSSVNKGGKNMNEISKKQTTDALASALVALAADRLKHGQVKNPSGLVSTDNVRNTENTADVRKRYVQDGLSIGDTNYGDSSGENAQNTEKTFNPTSIPSNMVQGIKSIVAEEMKPISESMVRIEQILLKNSGEGAPNYQPPAPNIKSNVKDDSSSTLTLDKSKEDTQREMAPDGNIIKETRAQIKNPPAPNIPENYYTKTMGTADEERTDIQGDMVSSEDYVEKVAQRVPQPNYSSNKKFINPAQQTSSIGNADVRKRDFQDGMVVGDSNVGEDSGTGTRSTEKTFNPTFIPTNMIQGKYNVKFKPNKRDVKSSKWNVYENGRLRFSVSLKQAFKDYKGRWKDFISPEYGRELTAQLNDLGVLGVLRTHFGNGRYATLVRAQVPVPPTPASPENKNTEEEQMMGGDVNEKEPLVNNIEAILVSVIAPIISADPEKYALDDIKSYLTSLANDDEALGMFIGKVDAEVKALKKEETQVATSEDKGDEQDTVPSGKGEMIAKSILRVSSLSPGAKRAYDAFINDMKKFIEGDVKGEVEDYYVTQVNKLAKQVDTQNDIIDKQGKELRIATAKIDLKNKAEKSVRIAKKLAMKGHIAESDINKKAREYMEYNTEQLNVLEKHANSAISQKFEKDKDLLNFATDNRKQETALVSESKRVEAAISRSEDEQAKTIGMKWDKVEIVDEKTGLRSRQ